MHDSGGTSSKVVLSVGGRWMNEILRIFGRELVSMGLVKTWLESGQAL